MISLLVWPCSDPDHRDCYGVVNCTPMLLAFLQKKEVPSFAYLVEHVSYDEAYKKLCTDVFAKAVDNLYKGFSHYDLCVCEELEHRGCYDVVDVSAYVADAPNVQVLSHVSYIEALSKLYELWQTKNMSGEDGMAVVHP